jgi:uncharacterized tellurite resistance protein B-like protein
MLNTLKDLFDSLTRAPARPAASTSLHQLQLATAVLLVEVMRADASLHADERDAVLATLARKFALAPDEQARLLELATAKARVAHDLHSFTTVLNEQYTDAQKLAVVEAMWQIAFADGHLAAHEQHILWRVADLLHVPHGAYIHAKMRAQAAAGAA